LWNFFDYLDFQWAVGKAAAMLRDGSVVAVPTDTIYGLITLIGYSGKCKSLGLVKVDKKTHLEIK
jgi:tRNA A37 threonylcarbamoyladenosine synthetase subunit TsaC/SUA5/YrdC